MISAQVFNLHKSICIIFRPHLLSQNLSYLDMISFLVFCSSFLLGEEEEHFKFPARGQKSPAHRSRASALHRKYVPYRHSQMTE